MALLKIMKQNIIHALRSWLYMAGAEINKHRREYEPDYFGALDI
jgi:hypothetical protein